MILDASGTTGGARTYAFDLDGNGSFETHCGSNAKAVVAYTKPGTYTVAATATFDTGKTGSAKDAVTVSGAPAAPPAGAAKLTTGVIVGGCALVDLVQTAIKIYECPTTVTVGIAEAVYFPNSAGWCFKRVHKFGRELFVGPGFPHVNGVTLSTFQPGASLAIDATTKRIYDVDASFTSVLGGKAKADIDSTLGISLASKPFPLDWDVSKPSVVQELSFDSSGSSEQFLGLDVTTATAPLSLTAAKGAQVPVGLALPFPLDSIGVDGSITLKTDNTDGPVLEAFHVDASGLLGDVLGVNAHLAYSRAGTQNFWNGSWSVAIPPITVSGDLGFSNGVLQTASLTFQHDPGLGPIWCCVFVTEIDGHLTSSSISAGVTLSAGPSYGGIAAASLHGQATIDWSPFMLTATGGLSLVGVPLGANASVVVLPYMLAFTGHFQKSVSILSVDAGVTGEFDTNGYWFAIGNGEVCVDFGDWIGSVCAGGGVGVGSAGVAGCVSLTIVEGGAYLHWDGGVGLFWGCSFGKLKSHVTYSRRQLDSLGLIARRSVTVPVRAGETAVLFKVVGDRGAPRVRVTGPRGASFDSPGAKGQPFTDRRTWLAIPVPRENATYVAVKRPAAGRWTITALPGSAGISSVEHADGLPSRIASGTLSGKGRTRVLSYSLKTVAGQTVTFVERGRSVEHLVGTAMGRRGTLRFTIADGPAGPRRIDALVRFDGLQVRDETVARFRAPGPLVLPAPRVVVTRGGGALVVHWLPVAGAYRYAVGVSLADGRRRSTLLGGRRGSMRVPRVGARARGTVRVTALSRALRPGKTGHARLAALPPVAAATTRLDDVLRAGAVTLRCVAEADGTCSVRVELGGHVVASGSQRVRYAAPATLRARLTGAGRTLLRNARGGLLRLEVRVPGLGKRVLQLRLR